MARNTHPDTTREKALAYVRRFGGIMRPYTFGPDGEYLTYGVTDVLNRVIPIRGSVAFDNYRKRFLDLTMDPSGNDLGSEYLPN